MTIDELYGTNFYWNLQKELSSIAQRNDNNEVTQGIYKIQLKDIMNRTSHDYFSTPNDNTAIKLNLLGKEANGNEFTISFLYDGDVNNSLETMKMLHNVPDMILSPQAIEFFDFENRTGAVYDTSIEKDKPYFKNMFKNNNFTKTHRVYFTDFGSYRGEHSNCMVMQLKNKQPHKKTDYSHENLEVEVRVKIKDNELSKQCNVYQWFVTPLLVDTVKRTNTILQESEHISVPKNIGQMIKENNEVVKNNKKAQKEKTPIEISK